MKRCAELCGWLGLAVVAALPPGCGTNRSPEVVVYVAIDRGDAEPLLKEFEAASDIHVRAVYDAEAAKTTGLVTRLLAESQSPRCDVFWNNELAQTLLLADRGVLDRYDSPQAADIPSDLKAADGKWTSVAMRARVIVYNTEFVPSEQVPRSLFDLVRSEWRGKCAVANPQFGTTRSHAAALFAALGPDEAKKWFDDLSANDVRIVEGNAMVKNLVARARPGASPVLVGLTDTDDVLSGQAEGEPVGMVFPDQDGLGTLLVPSSVALVRGAPHGEAARRLIDYLLSRQVEAALTADGKGYLPVRPDSPQPKFVSHAAPLRSMKVKYADIYEQLDSSSRWTLEHFGP
ncbi:MAG TPA: extracellular solute-binding protein [Pirellulales bacterium]|nr:extracellular solute-binding protein [Pirellulales bacterium]